MSLSNEVNAGAPAFSVIVPLYNKCAYIRRAVESVLDQSWANYELIVVDDGSTDGSLDEIADIEDSRVRLIRQNNMGGAGGQARNTGMAMAKGLWFAFLDGDDVWLANHLEEISRIIERYPEPGLVSTRPVAVQEGELFSSAVCRGSVVRRIDYFRESARNIGCNNCSSSAIHRDVFDRLGGFINAPSGPDLEYWARVALQYPVSTSERVTSVYYRGNGGNMEQLSARKAGRPTVSSLRELSPSVAMLCDHAQEDADFWSNTSICAYVNGRLESGLLGSLYRGDFDNARSIAKLMKRPISVKHKLYQYGLQLPDGALFFLISRSRQLRGIKD